MYTSMVMSHISLSLFLPPSYSPVPLTLEISRCCVGPHAVSPNSCVPGGAVPGRGNSAASAPAVDGLPAGCAEVGRLFHFVSEL